MARIVFTARPSDDPALLTRSLPVARGVRCAAIRWSLAARGGEEDTAYGGAVPAADLTEAFFPQRGI
jgi:hypothetical protein